MKGDDGFGSVFIEKIKGKIKAICINAGTSPENFIGSVLKENPDTILFVDAVHMDIKPGQYKILKPSDILKSGFTTHDLSPRMFIEYIKNETKADIYILGVQPQNIAFGDEMSYNVKMTLENLTKLMKELNYA